MFKNATQMPDLALKFYASALKQKEDEKFMITESVYPSDDDIDVDLVISRNGRPVDDLGNRKRRHNAVTKESSFSPNIRRRLGC